MASVKLCPKCGGTLVAVGERTGGFSGKKAVVGAVVAGPVGVAAGALGKQLVTLKCEKCGYTVETDAKSAEAAEQYGSTHEIMENLQRSIANMQSAGKATAWSFDTCRNVFNESLTTQRLQQTTIATDGVKKQRFTEFLNRRRDLLETLTQSVIDSSGKAIQASVEKAFDDEARKLTDKMVYWYFK